MKVLGRLFLVLAALSAIGLVATWPVESSYASKAKPIQIVQKPTDDLFGDAPTPVGSAQVAVLDDPKAFLPGKSADGAFLADDAYLTAHHLRPLQVKTVNFIAGLARLGLGAATVGFGLLGWLIGAFAKRREARTAIPAV